MLFVLLPIANDGVFRFHRVYVFMFGSIVYTFPELFSHINHHYRNNGSVNKVTDCLLHTAIPSRVPPQPSKDSDHTKYRCFITLEMKIFTGT